MSKSDITFIVQGKLHINSINNIDNMLKHGKIIFSYYNNDDLNMENILKEKIKNNTNIVLLSNDFIHNPPGNRQNVFYQAYTTWEALKICDTKFSIKLRSDEMYEDFSTLIKNIENNQNKFNTINFLFRKDNVFKFHPSDHLFGASTDLLIKTFQIFFDEKIYINFEHLPAEVKIFICFLKAKKILPEAEKSIQIMKQNCTITNLNNFKKFIIKMNCANDYKNPRNFTESDIFEIENDKFSINKLEDL